MARLHKIKESGEAGCPTLRRKILGLDILLLLPLIPGPAQRPADLQLQSDSSLRSGVRVPAKAAETYKDPRVGNFMPLCYVRQNRFYYNAIS